MSHERSAGTAHCLSGFACRDVLRRGVGLEESCRLTCGGGSGSRSDGSGDARRDDAYRHLQIVPVHGEIVV